MRRTNCPRFRLGDAPGSRHKEQIAGVGAHIGILISSVIGPEDLANSFNSTVFIGADQDVQAYTANSNLPVPTVTIRPVDGGSGTFDPNSDDGAEASLDTQMSLGTAPGATETLYNIPVLTDAEIMAGYTAINEDNIVDVVSSSFGECELDFTAAYNNGTDFTSILKTFHALFQQGNAQGITFLASSGDNGAPGCVSQKFADSPVLIDGTNFVLGVENPADDPNVTAVGGTKLQTVATPGVNDATYLSENADFDPRLPIQFLLPDGTVGSIGNNTWGSGGGFSQVFSKPLYQFLVNTGSNVHRAVPDVSLMMGGCPGDADLAAQDCTQLPRSAISLAGRRASPVDRHQLFLARDGGRAGAGGRAESRTSRQRQSVDLCPVGRADHCRRHPGAQGVAVLPSQYFRRQQWLHRKAGAGLQRSAGQQHARCEELPAAAGAVPAGTPSTPSNP